MSDKKKWPAEEANNVAIELVRCLRLFSDLIEVAGSLRRKKSEVGDVEILYIPRFEHRPDGLFDQKRINLADEQIERWLKDGVLAKRPSKIGVFSRA